MKHPPVVVIVEYAGKRLSVDARIYPLVVDCGCWGHAAAGGRTVEIAITPGGVPVGMRTRTDEPFRARVSAGPVGVHVDTSESLVLQEQRDHEDDMKRLAKIKQKQLDLLEQQETKKAKRTK